ncbi:hypothetical protein MKEN_00112200 [Mycena kentingensis (nom. inval.)]|nr:hypothetical protein MKEN_00112200 [Mycena kentingensis (nom. inval.)]
MFLAPTTRTLVARNAHLMIPAATAAPATRGRRYRPRGRPSNNAAGSTRSATTAAATRPAPQSTPTASALNTQAPTPIRQPSPVERDQKHFSARRFADAPISEASKQGIKHEFMSDVQAATIDHALSGVDLLVQAKTGTGKTLAFLLPSIERMAKMKDLAERKISMLVLSPTRELALQIEEEAHTLIEKHPFSVKHAIGGTNMNATGQRILQDPPRILIATPGRLLDHLENTANFKHLFKDLRVIVYDEADRLLDQGFRRELDKILAFLPDKTKFPRQALLFSATVSSEIKQVAKSAMSPGYKFVSTLKEDEINAHEHVPQQSLVLPFDQHFAATLAFLQQDRALHRGSSKTMIFLPTARAVGFFAEALSKLPPGTLPPVYDIHSRKSQPARNKAAESFKAAKEAVLISSDVTARGMDFPGVTLIIQTGLPANAEQYIHRLGRTARAGASGRGVLVLSEAESFFLNDKTIRGFGLTQVPKSPSETGYHLPDEQLAMAADAMRSAISGVTDDVKAQAYRAWLGFYNGSLRNLNWTKEQLVREANAYVMETLGWTGAELPTIEKKAIGMMNLRNVPGLNVVASPPKPQRTNK